MKLGVVIVTFNRVNLLKECVNAVLNQTVNFDKIIVVNNASTDETEQYLSGVNNDNVQILTLPENLGGAGGFYAGVKEFKEKTDMDYILLIDDDAILDKKYNEEIVKAIENCKDNNIAAYSGSVTTEGKIQYSHRSHLQENLKIIPSMQNEYEKDYFDCDLGSFCGLYVPMELINKIGLPEKDFFIWYDDTEYSLRISKYGKIRNVNSAIIDHKTKEKKDEGYSWKSYYGLRNSLYIIKKYYGKSLYVRKCFEYRMMKVAAKIFRLIKNDIYYSKVSEIYKDALNDVEKIGKNSKYLPGYKISKKGKK